MFWASRALARKVSSASGLPRSRFSLARSASDWTCSGSCRESFEHRLSARCFTTTSQKLARKELEKSKQPELAVPHPLSSTYRYVITAQLQLVASTYRYVITAQLQLEIAVPRPLASTYRYVITTQLQLEIAVPRPLASTYRYVITTQLQLEIAVPRPVSSSFNYIINAQLEESNHLK